MCVGAFFFFTMWNSISLRGFGALYDFSSDHKISHPWSFLLAAEFILFSPIAPDSLLSVCFLKLFILSLQFLIHFHISFFTLCFVFIIFVFIPFHLCSRTLLPFTNFHWTSFRLSLGVFFVVIVVYFPSPHFTSPLFVLSFISQHPHFSLCLFVSLSSLFLSTNTHQFLYISSSPQSTTTFSFTYIYTTTQASRIQQRTKSQDSHFSLWLIA